MKNLWNKLSSNRKLLWGCVAGVVCLCLVLGVVLLGGGNGGQGGESSGDAQLGGNTAESTQQPATDALPGESTGGGETEPVGESTAPIESTEATEPTPTETVPETEPEPTVTEPEETWIPTEDPNATPTEKETFDFGNWTPDNLTYEEWNSWSWEKQNEFTGSYNGGMYYWSAEEKHNFYCMENDNYDCGYEGHWCTDELHHAAAMAKIKAGCDICGKHDCPSLFSHDIHGDWAYDQTLCPEYDVKKDEMMYCQECGRPTWSGAESGEYYCTGCSIFAEYWICDVCGEKVYPGECHNIHKKP